MTRKAKTKDKKLTRKERKNSNEENEDAKITFMSHHKGTIEIKQIAISFPSSDMKKVEIMCLMIAKFHQACKDHVKSNIKERNSLLEMEKHLYLALLEALDGFDTGKRKKLEHFQDFALEGLQDLHAVAHRVAYLKKKRREVYKYIKYVEQRFPPRPNFTISKIEMVDSEVYVSSNENLP